MKNWIWTNGVEWWSATSFQELKEKYEAATGLDITEENGDAWGDDGWAQFSPEDMLEDQVVLGEEVGEPDETMTWQEFADKYPGQLVCTNEY